MCEKCNNPQPDSHKEADATLAEGLVIAMAMADEMERKGIALGTAGAAAACLMAVIGIQAKNHPHDFEKLLHVTRLTFLDYYQNPGKIVIKEG